MSNLTPVDMTRIEFLTGTHLTYSQLIAWERKWGIKFKKSKTGRPFGFKNDVGKDRYRAAAERARQMAALRPELTYKQIGEKFGGITRERVRQILNAHGYDNVIGHRKIRYNKTCKGCGEEMRLFKSQITIKIFCSKTCGHIYRATHRTPREDEVLRGALKFRAEGKPWWEVAKLLGYKAEKGHGTPLAQQVSKMAAKDDTDVSAMYGFMNYNGKITPRQKPKPNGNIMLVG